MGQWDSNAEGKRLNSRPAGPDMQYCRGGGWGGVRSGEGRTLTGGGIAIVTKTATEVDSVLFNNKGPGLWACGPVGCT